MVTMIFKVDASGDEIQGVKELISMEIEKKYPGVKCVDIREDDPPKQQSFAGFTR